MKDLIRGLQILFIAAVFLAALLIGSYQLIFGNDFAGLALMGLSGVLAFTAENY